MPFPDLTPAFARRASLAASPQTNAYRLYHRAADGDHRFALDRYGDVLVLHLYTEGQPLTLPPEWLAALAAKTKASAIYVKHRPTQANTLNEAAHDLAPALPIWGQTNDEFTVLENNLRFIIRPGDGLSTGIFLDMREVRQWVRDHAHNKTVLNGFAYTCGFGVAALAGGATRAVNIDMSQRYLNWGKANVHSNGVQPVNTDFIKGDVFDWLQRFHKREQTFDMVIMDPPSYSTTRETRFTVKRDYADLVARAASVTAPGGYMVLCANCHQLTQKQFNTALREGLANYKTQSIWNTHEPTLDFPRAKGVEGYLKVSVVQKS